jgi:hypothetical protein
MYQGNPTHAVKICDHLTTRPVGFRRQRTRSILHDYLSQTPSLDLSRKPHRIEALADFTLSDVSPRRNNQ